jgi:putative ABC transport system substrate-binding protein
MRRREFIKVIAGAAAAWPLAARAQQTLKAAHIGYLAFRSPMSADDSFFQGLRNFGWIEGQNILIERRFAVGNANQLEDSAAELVRLKVDVIVAVASAATLAAKDTTTSIPIVFVNAGDPVGQGFVQSLAHPAGNITGIALDASPDITAKQAQLLLEVLPKASRLAVLWNPTSAVMRSYWNVMKASAPALHIELQSLEVQDPNELEGAFDAMTRQHADGLLVLADSFLTFVYRARLTELAAKHKLPTIYGDSRFIEAGGLMSYGLSRPPHRAATQRGRTPQLRPQ